MTLAATALSLSVFACQPLVPLKSRPRVVLHADSAEVPVHFNQHAYFAKIGFMFVNDTDQPLSRATCGPILPALEKRIDGHWVAAYYPFSLMCRIMPDPVVPPGTTFRDVLEFVAFEPGHQMGPELRVKSIDGVYRLRLGFTEGTDATAKGARYVEATSNEFRMVLLPVSRSPRE
jgi:hypothetical protein